jgi:hypothetical protein
MAHALAACRELACGNQRIATPQQGKLTVIVGPLGQRTSFTLDGDAYLASVTDRTAR